MIFAHKRQDVARRKHDVFINVNAISYELICIFNPTSGLSFLMHGFITYMINEGFVIKIDKN